MRLFEVIPSVVNPPKRYSGTWKGRDDEDFGLETTDTMNPKTNVVGTGGHSTVKQDRDDEQSVVRYQHWPTPEREASYLYAQYVMENKLWTNPHFPRFYELDTYEDQEGRYIHKLKMEKLHHYRSLSIEEIRAMIRLYFTEEGERSLLARVKSEIYHDKDDPFVYFKALSMMLSSCYNNSDYQNVFIQNQSLDNAITNLRMIEEEIDEQLERDITYDLRMQNIMIRRTPYGAQVVFADPFVGGGDD